MDVLQTGLGEAANVILNAYCDLDDGPEPLQGLRALSLFGAVRAMVRAMVSAEKQMGVDDAARDFSETHRYLDLAQMILHPAAPRLVAIGGLSGTGKTTVARALAPHIGGAFGAIHIRSDIERKRLAAVDPLDPLPEKAYTSQASIQTYKAVAGRAETCLRAGQSVIVDAVFAKEEQRQAIQDLASRLGIEFTGIWLDASQDDRLQRVAGRKNDASDADQSVVCRQSSLSVGRMDWLTVSSHGGREETLARVRAGVSTG